MIDPRTQYILYKERENQLTAEIERKHAALGRCKPRPIRQSWYSVVVQWLKEMVFSHGNIHPFTKISWHSESKGLR